MKEEGKRQRDEGRTIGEALRPRREKAQPAEHPDLPYIGLEHVEAHSMRLLGSVPAETMRSQANRFYVGDVLYSRLRPYLNKVWLADRDGLCSSEFIVLPGNEVTDSDFLRYRLNARDFVQFANSLNAGDRPRVDFDQISSFLLPPFSLEQQRRIVVKIEELFSELDEGVANLKKARAQLAVYRQALLKHAFEGHLTADWRAKQPSIFTSLDQVLEQLNESRVREYEKRLKQWDKLVQGWKLKRPNAKAPAPPPRPKSISTHHSDPSLPSLPTGWLYLKVGDLSDVVRGGSPRPAGDPKFYDGDIPFLKVADLTRKEGAFVDSHSYTIKEAGLQKTRFVMPPTLLISNSGATLGVPKVCTIEATFNDGVAAFLGVPEPEQLYHYYFWESRTQQLRNIDQGAAQPNLNTDLLRDYLIPVCSKAEMTEVTNRLAEQLSTISALEADIDLNLQKAEALRQSILKKAFAGELVPQDPADEPASELLARIRAERETRDAKPAAKRSGKRPPKTA